MKFISKVSIILSVIAFSQSLTMSWGNLRDRNLLLFDQFFHEKREANHITCKEFNFSSMHGALITAIHVTDLTLKQDGGRVKIICGGVGFNFVKLQMVSDCDRQLLLNMEIYGS